MTSLQFCCGSRHLCGLAHLLETELAQGEWYRSMIQRAHMYTNMPNNNKENKKEEAMCIIHIKYAHAWRSHTWAIVCIYSSHLGVQRGRMIQTKDDAKVCSTSGCHHWSVPKRARVFRCVYYFWLLKNNWDWYWSRVTAALAATQQPPKISTGEPMLLLAKF